MSAGQGSAPNEAVRRSPVERTRNWWWIYLLVGIAATISYAAVAPSVWSVLLYLPIAGARVVATIIALRVYRPPCPRPWYCLIGAATLWTLAEAFEIHGEIAGYLGDRVSISDGLYVLGYLSAATAVVLFLRGGGPRIQRNGLLDCAIVMIALVLLAWVFFVVPATRVHLDSGFPAILRMGYPLGDIIVLGLLVWLGSVAAVRTPAYRLFFASILVWGAANAAYDFTTFSGESSQTALRVAWLVSHVLWGAAVLHPSISGFWSSRDDLNDVFTVGRFVTLLLATISSSVALMVQLALHQPLDVVPIASATILMVTLFTVRVRRLIGGIREQGRRLVILSSTDPLTGLPNRRQFVEQVEESLASPGSQPAVLRIGLDRFRSINEALGADVSNAVLGVLVERWARRLRPDDVLARLADDEFGVLLPGEVSDMEAVAVAWSLQKSMDDSVDVRGLSLAVGANIGVAVAPPDEPEDQSTGRAEALLRHAHVAAVAAGQRLSHVVSFTKEIDSLDAARILLLNELPGALARNELVLHYQPKVELGTGRVLSVEALVRWQHPAHGLLYPKSFIQMAEQTALIHDLTRYVLRRALEDLSRWRREGLQVGVAVNLSVRNLLDPKLFDDVQTGLERCGVPPSALELEVTESSAMSDFPGSLAMLARLDRLGVALSIDDYGTGYGSLAYLRQLPVQTLKIDRSFVGRMTTNESDAAIVRSTIDLARSLGLSVVAEGVENPETFEALLAASCYAAQGYFFGEPVTAAQVPAVARRLGAGLQPRVM